MSLKLQFIAHPAQLVSVHMDVDIVCPVPTAHCSSIGEFERAGNEVEGM